MRVFILNSAPGVGKTSLINKLNTTIKEDFAFFDGDDVGRIVPYQLNKKWLNLIQDNLVCCAANCTKYNINNIVISFVFPTTERVERIKNKLIDHGFDVIHIALTCEKEELLRRLRERNNQKIVDIESGVKYNEMIKDLDADFLIDTTKLSKIEVAYELLKIINDI
jgi:chloramphenicol 3-O-phosphotransferase